MTPPLVDPALMRRIEAEFREMPGLVLTAEQAQRLWGLEPSICQALLSALVDANFLRRRPDGSFVRFDSGRVSV